VVSWVAWWVFAAAALLLVAGLVGVGFWSRPRGLQLLGYALCGGLTATLVSAVSGTTLYGAGNWLMLVAAAALWATMRDMI